MSETKRRIIAVDIDGTLCNNVEWWRGVKPTPNNFVIQQVNKLYDSGNFVIIHTSRRREDEWITKEWLAENKVKYHILVLDKLSADFYIDDKAVLPEDISKICKERN